MNLYRQFLAMLPASPLDVGRVTARYADGATVQLISGGYVRVRGEAALNDLVYVRDGLIEGPAPDLPGTDIEV